MIRIISDGENMFGYKEENTSIKLMTSVIYTGIRRDELSHKPLHNNNKNTSMGAWVLGEPRCILGNEVTLVVFYVGSYALKTTIPIYIKYAFEGQHGKLNSW